MRAAEAVGYEESVPDLFLRDAALGLATLEPEDLAPGVLTLPLALSTWIRRAGIGPVRACDGLMLLRSAFVGASGLDERSEPVPLRGSDSRTTVVNLAVYLDGLVGRGARAAHTTRVQLAEEALALLDR
jgi:hypothetical protein